MSAAAKPSVPAAGAVLWCRDAGGELVVALIHRPRYDDWSLPKGKLDPGETAPVAAVREIHEETGRRAVLGRYLARIEYEVSDGVNGDVEDTTGKTVDYFAAHARGGTFRASTEVDDLRWLPPREAARVLSYPAEVDVLTRFLRFPAETTTLLLVRHAKAGNREDWSGDDDLRPLSEAGSRQAEALRRLLRAFDPDRVLAAPRLRCVQTVRGCAEELGTEVGHEPLLTEESYAHDPVRTTARLGRIAADGGTPLVCSQGAVIPYVIGTLAERDGVELPARKNNVGRSKPVACKKGSLWLLTFSAEPVADRPTDQPRLFGADYFPSALPTPATTAR